LCDVHRAFDLGQSCCTTGIVTISMHKEKGRLLSLDTLHDSLSESSTCCAPPRIRPRSRDFDASEVLLKKPIDDGE
jgi:hypothetical protein